VELIVNGRSMGRKKIDRVNGDRYTGDWEVAYEPGEIVGIAYDENGKEIARESRKSYGEPTRLQIRECKVGRELTAGARDYAFLEVSAIDAEGNEVSNANNRINVTVEGAGWIAGLDNGDSTDMDQYKGSTKRLFSGKMLICVAIGSRTGKIAVSVASEGLEGASIELNVEKSIVIEGMSLVPEYECAAKKEGVAIKEGIAIKNGVAESVDIRKIELVSSCCSLNAELDSVMVHARLFTGKGSVIENSAELAAYNLKWKAVNDSGIESPLASIEPVANDVVLVRAKGDGIFHLRCSAFDEKGVARVISQLDFSVSGIGESLLNPYGYIAGGMWDYAEGEMGSGNNHGVATPRGERAVVGFDKIDFGSYGSDEIKIDLFVLTSDEFPIQIWQGIPGEKGSEMLADVIYCKPSIWNTYQPETYRLNCRVNGIQRICFVTQNKAHIGGFSFIEKNKAYERLEGASCDNVYGDAFTVGEHTITDIGNNVTIEYYDMDFGTDGPSFVEIEGFT